MPGRWRDDGKRTEDDQSALILPTSKAQLRHVTRGGGAAAKTAMTHISVKGGFGLLQLLPQILRKQGDKRGKEEIET